MRKNAKRLTVAALAGTAGIFSAHSAQASFVITSAETPAVVFNNGTYDKYTFTLSSLGGTDTTSGPASQNPEILLLEGTFSATGTGATLLVPGDANSANNGYWTKFITKGATLSPSYGNSTVNLPSENENFPPARGTPGVPFGATYTSPASPSSSTVTGITGTASNFKASWFVAPTNAAHAGGIEASTTGNAAQSRVAIIYVTPGGGVSFNGDYGTYAAGGTQTMTFASAGLVTTTTSAKPLVSLTAEGSQLAGYGSNTIPLLHVVGSNGGYIAAHDGGLSTATGDANVTGFSPATDNETYALKFSNTLSGLQITALITEINLNSATDGLLAVVPTADIAALFPGYQIELTATTSKSASQDLGFDFSGATSVAGLTVTDVAAVPEPVSAATLLLGASGLLLGRRKRNA
jgi:hypothetical protein